MDVLRVTAHMATSLTQHDPWSPDLVGILSAAWFMQRDPEAFYMHKDGAGGDVAELPIARVGSDDDPGWWCSSPITNVHQRWERYQHSRFDHDFAADHGAKSVKSVLTAGGQYKSRRTKFIMTLTDTVVWHVVGDADGVHALLNWPSGHPFITNIGQGHDVGWGRVARWEITGDGDLSLARYHRPLPVVYAREHGIDGITMNWGVVPPGRLAKHKRLCVMPPEVPVCR